MNEEGEETDALMERSRQTKNAPSVPRLESVFSKTKISPLFITTLSPPLALSLQILLAHNQRKRKNKLISELPPSLPFLPPN